MPELPRSAQILLRALALALAVATASSCRSYNDRVRAGVQAFEAGRFDLAEAEFQELGSPFLRAAEAGMAAFADGRFEAARSHFNSALAASEGVQERSPVDPMALADSFLALAINESQASYAGEGYERVMLHAMLGLTYLADGRAESVVVEARRVDEVLTGEEELYETSYGAGGIGHLLSAVAYELSGQPGEAYIDYQRMLDKGVGGELVEAALLRLSRRLGRAQDVRRWEERFGERVLPGPDAATIVLIGGLGMGPAKFERRIDVALPGRIVPWAVPRFDGGQAGAEALDLVFPDSGVRLRSSVVENVAAVARENLEDRIAYLAARSAFRGIAKSEVARNLQKNDRTWVQALGGIMSVVSVLSERADLRAWRTLPRTWVAARAFVPPDEPIEVDLAEAGGDRVRLGTYRFVPGETMFVIARSVPGGLFAHVIGGEPVPDTQPIPEPNP